MKLDNLKQLVKEKLNRTLNENIQVNLSPSETGTYEIKYIIMDADGGPDYSENITLKISKEDIEKYTWEEIIRDSINFKIYKIEKIVKK
jgi:hypothetical protein